MIYYLISILSLIGAAICYAVIETLQIRHDKSIWANKPLCSFWGATSWTRKYYRNPVHGVFEQAPDKWYYRYFHLKYREKFPGSATVFVFLTDAHHFFQWLMFNFIALSLVLVVWHGHSFGVILVGFVLVRVLFSTVFGLFFERIFTK